MLLRAVSSQRNEKRAFIHRREDHAVAGLGTVALEPTAPHAGSQHVPWTYDVGLDGQSRAFLYGITVGVPE